MTDIDTTPEGLPEDPADLDLMDWITSGTVGRRDVVIYNDVAAAKRMVEVEARLTELGYDDSADPDADAPVDDQERSPEITGLLEEAEELLDRVHASKATWTVRALTGDEIDQTLDDAAKTLPPVRMPMPPGPGASDSVQKKFLDRMQAYQKAQRELSAEHDLHLIAQAVVQVATPRGVTESVTVEQLRALRARPHGKQWIDKLNAGIAAATEADVKLPGPTSPERSTPGQD